MLQRQSGGKENLVLDRDHAEAGVDLEAGGGVWLEVVAIPSVRARAYLPEVVCDLRLRDISRKRA